MVIVSLLHMNICVRVRKSWSLDGSLNDVDKRLEDIKSMQLLYKSTLDYIDAYKVVLWENAYVVEL